MRFALILSLILAVFAVVFALGNPGYTDVNLGFTALRASTALVLMVTFGIGVVVGILAAVPTLVQRRRKIRKLESRLAETSPAATYTAPTEPVVERTPPHRDVTS